ncbi:hypothetical protein ACILE2_11595 [Capnocytophaga canimorsus]|uniref:hypothetical protein n=1 Tax=Capnocytophaga canimorsus TaxID=28188 RepID=UPI0037D25A1A
MAKTSIHFEPCNVVKSELHNSRQQELDYIFPELSKNNESLYYIADLKQREQQCKQIYEQKVGQKMQTKTVPLREAVVVIDERTTLYDLEILANEIQHELKWQPLQIHIHRDEGYMKNPDNKGGYEVAKLNLHAHIVFDCQDKSTGKMHRISKQNLSNIQTITANVLKMERGEKSDRKHLKSLEFKIAMKKQELAEKEKIGEKYIQEIFRLTTEITHLKQKIADFSDYLEKAKENVDLLQNIQEKGVQEVESLLEDLKENIYKGKGLQF